MTTYNLTKEWTGGGRDIDETSFNELIRIFQKSYLERERYTERLALHRNPIEVKNEMLNKLNRYYVEIQNRSEMRDLDTEKNESERVPSVVKELWKGDKRIRSLYNAVKQYCELRNKDFNTIAIHIAEFRAMSKLIDKIQVSVSRSKLSQSENVDNTKPVVNNIAGESSANDHGFIKRQAVQFAKITEHNTTQFEKLSVLKKRLEEELSPYEGKNKQLYLGYWKEELDALFAKHLKGCHNPEQCPQHKTSRNANFLFEQFHQESYFITDLPDLAANERFLVFISHSSKDVGIVKLFVDKILRLGLGIGVDKIFCTSIHATSIASGKDFRIAIKEKLNHSSHVVQIITPAYKASEVCLNEMGASWVLNNRVIPFVVEPINYESVGFIHSPNQLLKLTSEDDLLKFVDEIAAYSKNCLKPDPILLHTEIKRHVRDFIKGVRFQTEV